MNIPSKVLVGQKGNQGFLTYKVGDEIKFEKSWNNWLAGNNGKKFEIDNVPISGFKLKDYSGGKEHSWGHYTRSTYAVIIDPRGFDIEISFNNFIKIMETYSHIVDKGFEGEFVYGWEGQNLKLIPIVSEEYEKYKDNDTSVPLTVKELTIGKVYQPVNGNPMIYLGYHPLLTFKQDEKTSSIKFITKSMNCFKYVEKKYSPYAFYENSSKTQFIKVNINKDIDVNEEMRNLRQYYWKNDSYEAPDLDRFVKNENPNQSWMIDELIKYSKEPYKEWDNGYRKLNNCNEYYDNKASRYCAWRFVDDYKTAICYQLHYYIPKNTGEKRIVYFRPYKAFTIKNKNTLERISVDTTELIKVEEFISKYKEDIYIAEDSYYKIYYIASMQNKSGFKFFRANNNSF